MHAKEALETSEKRYRMLLESANDAIFIADGSSGDLLDANQKAQAMVGRNLAEIQSMHLVGLHPKEFHETYKALF
jgi:PAS domain S-box-containing protein